MAITTGKLDTLTEITIPEHDDILYLESDPATNKYHRKVTLQTLRGQYNVMDYAGGVDIADGSTDATTAIQAAIDAAEAAGGGIVFLPAGRYLLSSALSLPSMVVLRGVTTYTGTVLQVASNVGVIVTDNDAVSWKIQDLAITVLEAAGSDTTTAAISLGSNNSQWEIENVEIIDSGSYDFQDGLYIPSGWTSTVKRFRCANAARYALNMAGGQAIHFDQCDFSGLDLTACALVAGNACTFTNCKFQGRPIGLSLTGNRNTFVTPWFENDYETDGLWCAQVSGSNNTFLNGSYTISGYTAGAASGYFKFTGSATQNQVINPRWDHPATASMVSLEGSAIFNEFYGGNVRWATVITQAGETNTYSMLSDTSAEQILRYWYGDDNVEVHFGDPSAGVRLKTGVSDVSSETSPGLYTTASGGSAPYDAWGNLIIKPRNQASRSVEVWTGATPTVKLKIDETAITGTLPFVAGADGATRGILTLWDGAGGNTPGYIKIHSPNGTAWYLFVEDDGTVKVHNAAPAANGDGSVIGAQT